MADADPRRGGGGVWSRQKNSTQDFFSLHVSYGKIEKKGGKKLLPKFSISDFGGRGCRYNYLISFYILKTRNSFPNSQNPISGEGGCLRFSILHLYSSSFYLFHFIYSGVGGLCVGVVDVIFVIHKFQGVGCQRSFLLLLVYIHFVSAIQIYM